MSDYLGPYLLGPNDTPENGIITGDARELAKAIPDESVDLILADPVYWEYDQYAFLAVLGLRVLKAGGSIIAQAGDAHRLGAENAMQHPKLIPCPLILEGMTGGHRQIWDSRSLSFVKAHIRVQKPGKPLGWMPNYIKGYGRDKARHEWGDTSAVFEEAILRLTPVDGIVVDPFTGGGTVPAVCKMLGRRYLAFEIDPDTAELARERVRNTQPPLFVLEPEQQALWDADDD